MNANTEIPSKKQSREQQDLIDFTDTAKLHNPIYDENPEATMVNVESVLCLLRDFVMVDDDDRITDEHSPAIRMILGCTIRALELQREYTERKAKLAKEA